MAKSMRDSSDQGFSVISTYYIGFALLVAAPVLCVLGMDGRDFVVLAVASAASCACVLTLCKNGARAAFIYRNRKAAWVTAGLFAAAVSPLALPLVGPFGQLADAVAQLVVGLLMGAGFSTLVLLWYSVGERLLAGEGDEGFHRISLASFGIACLCVALCAAFRGTLLIALCSAAFISSVALNRFAVTKVLGRADEEAPAEDAPEGPQMPAQHAGYPVLVGAACGAVAVSAMPVTGLPTGFAIVGIAGAAACVIVYAVIQTARRSSSFYDLERVAVPLTFSSSLFVPFINDSNLAAGAAVLLCAAGAATFCAAHFMLMMRWVQRWGCQPVRHFAYGTFTMAIGASLGFPIWCILSFASEARPQISEIVCITLLLALAIVSAFSPYGDLHEFDSLPKRKARVDQEFSNGIWETAISALAQDLKLTPREKEVATLLARGRNARRISEALVITEHTTKTHVSNIYKKAGVSSQQAFIDLVEAEVREIRKVAG